MKRVIIVTLSLVLLLLSWSCALGRTVEVTATDMAVIVSPTVSREARVLVRFPLPEVLLNCDADFACVSLDADCVSEKGLVSCQAFALTRNWNAQVVAWDDPWGSPGGDWDRSLSAYWIAEARSGETLQFDVTDFVNEWRKDASKNFGIILKVSGPFFGSFSVNEARTPRLRVLY